MKEWNYSPRIVAKKKERPIFKKEGPRGQEIISLARISWPERVDKRSMA
jgi:hypothetical protein